MRNGHSRVQVMATAINGGTAGTIQGPFVQFDEGLGNPFCIYPLFKK